MHSLLTTLRQNAPHTTARQFLAAQAGCWIQYYDDTPAKNPAKALSARTFDPPLARRKQSEGCAVAFSLQPFSESRTTDHILCFRTLGVDVDLVASPARRTLSPAAIDARKETYLRCVLSPFPLKPHWVVETRHGFHLLFRVQPVREPRDIADAAGVNRRLVTRLEGDRNAVLLTQLLRVPGTLQFKVPSDPFLCRLLLDNASIIPPYPLAAVRDALGVVGPPAPGVASAATVLRPNGIPRWRQGLAGAGEGERNVTAASLAGKILGRLPEELWETAGWGGLKEWNSRNSVPLPERELRGIFESIARREFSKRLRLHQPGGTQSSSPPSDAEPR